jgi:hypothetical protein
MDVNSFWNLKASDCVLLLGNLVMIWAVIKAPKWAVEAQWKLQLKKEERDRRLWIFKTLMSTRATPISPEHFQALNLIDVQFCSTSNSDIAIREAWSSLLANLNTNMVTETDEARINTWVTRNRDLLADLLSKMGAALDYKFDFTYLKEHSYYPKGHGDLNGYILTSQKGWAEVLSGNRALKMEIVNLPQQPPTTHGKKGK